MKVDDGFLIVATAAKPAAGEGAQLLQVQPAQCPSEMQSLRCTPHAVQHQAHYRHASCAILTAELLCTSQVLLAERQRRAAVNRRWKLPEDVLLDGVHASLRNGELVVLIPKRAQQVPSLPSQHPSLQRNAQTECLQTIQAVWLPA